MIIVDWILCPGEIKDYAIKTKILLSIDWLVTCNKIVIVVTTANEEEWIVTNIFLRFFENSSDELDRGNTHHFRKSIVNDESDER
jgi:hypothetical protein